MSYPPRKRRRLSVSRETAFLILYGRDGWSLSQARTLVKHINTIVGGLCLYSSSERHDRKRNESHASMGKYAVKTLDKPMLAWYYMEVTGAISKPLVNDEIPRLTLRQRRRGIRCQIVTPYGTTSIGHVGTSEK